MTILEQPPVTSPGEADAPSASIPATQPTLARVSTGSRGSGLLVDGRLEWREWDAQDGTKRQAVEIIADSTQFMGGREGGSGGGGGGAERPAGDFAPAGSAPMPTSASIADDDDIPF